MIYGYYTPNNQQGYGQQAYPPQGITREELEILKRFQDQIVAMQLKMQEAEVNKKLIEADKVRVDFYMNAMSELRSALNLPQVDGEHTPVMEGNQKFNPAFDEISLGRLQQRYLYLVDKFFTLLDPNYDPKTLDK